MFYYHDDWEEMKPFLNYINDNNKGKMRQL